MTSLLQEPFLFKKQIQTLTTSSLFSLFIFILFQSIFHKALRGIFQKCKFSYIPTFLKLFSNFPCSWDKITILQAELDLAPAYLFSFSFHLLHLVSPLLFHYPRLCFPATLVFHCFKCTCSAHLLIRVFAHAALLFEILFPVSFTYLIPFTFIHAYNTLYFPSNHNITYLLFKTKGPVHLFVH